MGVCTLYIQVSQRQYNNKPTSHCPLPMGKSARLRLPLLAQYMGKPPMTATFSALSHGVCESIPQAPQLCLRAPVLLLSVLAATVRGLRLRIGVLQVQPLEAVVDVLLPQC